MKRDNFLGTRSQVFFNDFAHLLGTTVLKDAFQWLLPNSVVAAYEPTFPIFGWHLVKTSKT